MKILVACEESQAVTIELRKLGHEAYSCDIEPCSGGHPEWHLQQDVIPLLKEKWDMIIAFPPCTYLTNAGTRHFSRRINPEEKVLARETLRQEAFDFFMLFVNANCDKIAIENPVGYVNGKFRKPNQIVHPFYYGDNAKKRTCLWLKGLPKLIPTDIVAGREQRIWKLPPGEERSKLRSKTYEGIAKAMAEQWTKPFPQQLTLI